MTKIALEEVSYGKVWGNIKQMKEIQKQALGQVPFTWLDYLLLPLIHKDYRLAYITVDNVRVGQWITYTKNQREHIMMFLIIPSYQSKGVGRHILKQAIQQCTKDGLTYHTRVGNRPMQKLGESLGFIVSEIIPNYYQDGEGGYLYELNLN